MGGRIDIILMCVKFSDNMISSLDLSFIGGCTLNRPISLLQVYLFKKNSTQYENLDDKLWFKINVRSVY